LLLFAFFGVFSFFYLVWTFTTSRDSPSLLASGPYGNQWAHFSEALSPWLKCLDTPLVNTACVARSFEHDALVRQMLAMMKEPQNALYVAR